MTNWPVHAAWNGPIVMIGFGSIGRGTLPLILRHIKCDPKQITVIDPDASRSQLVEKQGASFIKAGDHPEELPAGAEAAAHRRARARPSSSTSRSTSTASTSCGWRARRNALYIDTVIEPWPGFYYNTKIAAGATAPTTCCASTCWR